MYKANFLEQIRISRGFFTSSYAYETAKPTNFKNHKKSSNAM